MRAAVLKHPATIVLKLEFFAFKAGMALKQKKAAWQRL